MLKRLPASKAASVYSFWDSGYTTEPFNVGPKILGCKCPDLQLVEAQAVFQGNHIHITIQPIRPCVANQPTKTHASPNSCIIRWALIEIKEDKTEKVTTFLLLFQMACLCTSPSHNIVDRLCIFFDKDKTKFFMTDIEGLGHMWKFPISSTLSTQQHKMLWIEIWQ